MSGDATHRDEADDNEDHLNLIAQKMARAVDDLEALAANITLQFRTEGEGDQIADRIAVVQGYIRARRLRDQFLPSQLFGEPAWNILLDLYLAGLEGNAVSAAGACSASTEPPTTVFLWLDKLVDLGLIERIGDMADAPQANVRLTSSGQEAIGRWTEAALLKGCASAPS